MQIRFRGRYPPESLSQSLTRDYISFEGCVSTFHSFPTLVAISAAGKCVDVNIYFIELLSQVDPALFTPSLCRVHWSQHDFSLLQVLLSHMPCYLVNDTRYLYTLYFV